MKTLISPRFKRLTVFLVTVLFSVQLVAQSVFTKTEVEFPGESFNTGSHIASMEGGSMLLTMSGTSVGNYITMVKLDAAGNMQWHKRFGPGALSAEHIVQSPVDSGYFFCMMEQDASGERYQVVKTDKMGNIIFMRTLELPAQYSILSSGRAVARNNGGFYVASTVFQTTAFMHQWHLFGIDATGAITFSHCYGDGTTKSFCYDLDTCMNGDVMMIGDFLDFQLNQVGPAAIRTTPTGGLIWFKAYMVPLTSARPFSVTRVTGDFFCIASQTTGPLMSMYASVLKIDGAGNVVWNLAYHHSAISLNPRDIRYMPGGDLLLSGDAFMLKIDSAGLPVCGRTYVDITWMSIDTLSDSVYTYMGYNWWTSEGFFMTSDPCGVSCDGADLPVTKTPLTTTDTVLVTDIAVPMTNSPAGIATGFSTIHFPEVCSVILSSPPEQEVDLASYPNPAGDFISVTIANVCSSIELVDLNGQVVQTSAANGNTTIIIDVRALADGTYVLRADTAGGVVTKKIIVAHR